MERLFLLQAYLFLFAEAFPFPASDDISPSLTPDSDKRKRQEDESQGDPNGYVALLENLGKELNPDWLLDDLLLAQKLDRINDISKYTDPIDNSTVIVERNTLDANKAVVVLRSSEDKRQVNDNNKRTFTVLIRAPVNPEVKLAHYYMIFAYIRDAKPTDEAVDVHKAGANKVTVEWDIWDDRVPNPNFHPGWSTCAYTILFSCQINETVVEAAVAKMTSPMENALRMSSTTPNPLSSTPRPSAVTSINGPPSAANLIKAEGNTDPNEYIDLFGDFDVVPGDGKSGRSLFSGAAGTATCKSSFASFFGSSGCASNKPAAAASNSSSFFTAGGFFSQPAKKKKALKKTSSDSWIPGLSSFFGAASPGATPTKPASNADAVFGTYYKGLPGTPPIFLPDGSETTVLFVPDKETYTIHGSFLPGAAGYPDTFTPESASHANVFGVPGIMIPDGMTMASITGGIHGSLTGDSFRPENLGTAMWFNPDGPESKGVWTPYKKSNVTVRPKTTQSGEIITYGALFPGMAGSSDIFIPDGQGIPGFFVPNDPAFPDSKIMPHGSFVATKPAGHGTFYADNPKEVIGINQIRGAFMPDGMNLAGAIPGLITKEANSFVFVVDAPGSDLEFVKSKVSPTTWTPFLKPGEWIPPKPPAPPAPRTPPPGSSGSPGTGLESPVMKKKTNQAFMFGIKFSSMGSSDVFVPDEVPVDGQLIPEDSDKFKPCAGQIFGVGKSPDKIVFKPKTSGQMDGWPGMAAMFVPDGISPGNGIMGQFAIDTSNKDTANYFVEPPGKGYWYIKGKPENAAVWTPFVPPVLPTPPTLVEKMDSKPFVQGFYVPGVEGQEPVFVPDEGGIGCFVPDDGSPQSCGTYYPEKPGNPPEFIEDVPGTAKEGTKGSFVPKLADGAIATNKFHCTYNAASAAGGAPVPSALKPDTVPYTGWTQTDVKIQNNTAIKRTAISSGASNASSESKHPSNVPVPVGGGFNGFPTNGRGVEALVSPTNPVFKEYLQFKARADKTIDTNEKVVIVNNLQQARAPGVTYVSLDEYRTYVEERYVIKTTHIKTLDFDEQIEIAVPKAAEKYIKKKRKPIKIKLDIMSSSNAGAGAGAGAGGATAGGSGTGGVHGKAGGKDCKGGWASSASAIAKAENGSVSNAEANSINGGDAHALSISKDGGNATSAANTKEGGKANALSQALNGASTDAEANALNGASANALARKSTENATGTAISNAKKETKTEGDACDGGALPDEIEVDSHAAATALSGNGTGGGSSVNSVANTNVKIDMAGLAAKVMEMQSKLGDDDDGPEEISIAVNANAGAQGSATGRSFGGFDDLDSQSEKVNMALKWSKALAKAGVPFAAGWKTELKKIVPNVTLQHEREVFYGLGNCPFKHVEAPQEKDPETVIDFFLRQMRLECNDKVKLRIMHLFNEGFLNFDEGTNYFVIPSKNEIIKRIKIKDSELRLLSVAFEFSTFSWTYFEQSSSLERKDLAPYAGPEVGIPATRSVRFLTEFALNYIEKSHLISPHHKVRLTRNLLTTLRTAQLKLHQDGQAVKDCKLCVQDQDTNHNDQVHLMGLLQFIIHGIVPYERGTETNLRKGFKEFLILNRKTLESRVKDYEKQAPH